MVCSVFWDVLGPGSDVFLIAYLDLPLELFILFLCITGIKKNISINSMFYLDSVGEKKKLCIQASEQSKELISVHYLHCRPVSAVDTRTKTRPNND